MSRMPLSERRERLIDAAIKVITEEGLSAATTRSIVAAADMPLASFHYAFESHHVLLSHTLDVLIGIQEEELALPEIDSDCVGDLLRNTLNGWLDHLVERPEQHLAIRELTSYFMRSEEDNDKATSWRDRFSGVATELLQEFADAKAVEFTQSVKFLGSVIVTLFEGLESSYLIERNEETVRQTVQVWTDGDLFSTRKL